MLTSYACLAVEELDSSITPAKKLKHKVKSLSEDVKAKSSSDSEPEAKKKSKKVKKKKRKKTHKSKPAAPPASTTLQDQPVQLTGRTLMELLELEYRTKAIKALLKTQDVDRGGWTRCSV